MTKSRTLPALLLIANFWPAPGFGQGPPSADPTHEEAPLPQPGTEDAPTIVTADEAIAMSRRQVSDTVGRTCPPGTLDSDVLVCGRRESVSRYRLTLPIAPTRGTGERAGAEQLAQMNSGSERCSAVGRDQQCGGGFDMIGIGFAIVRGITQALANRD